MKKVTIPEGESGDWKVKKFTISKRDSLMSKFSYFDRFPLPGVYTKLTWNGRTIMSDTQAEQRDHIAPVLEAKGHILINGLGIGMVLYNSMFKEKVLTATVIENSIDVINIVGPYYKKIFGDRLEIIHADAYDWNPPKGVKYGMVWHDIWPDICSDNYKGMKKLHRKYGRRTHWQGSWSRLLVEQLVKEEKRDLYDGW